MSQTLMSIADDALALERLILEAGGELSPELEAWIAEIDTKLSQKADAYSFVMDRFESTAKLLRERAEKFTVAARSLDSASKRINERIKAAIMSMERTEVRGTDIVFKLQRSAPALELDEKQIPQEYQILTYAPDKKRITEELKAGKQIPGASLRQSYSLRTHVNKERGL